MLLSPKNNLFNLIKIGKSPTCLRYYFNQIFNYHIRYFLLVIFLFFNSNFLKSAQFDPVDDLIKIAEEYVSVEIDHFMCEIFTENDGFYYPKSNVLHFCPTNIKTNWEGWNGGDFDINQIYRSALIHELIHVAQDCHAGLFNKEISVIGKVDNVHPAIIEDYEPEDYLMEAEAFSYIHREHDALALLERECGNPHK